MHLINGDDIENIDEMMRRADPASHRALHATATSEAADDLCATIVSSPRRRRHSHRSAAVLAVAAVAIAALVGLVVVPTHTNDAYAAQIARTVGKAPQLLLRGSGWSVTDIYVDGSDNGYLVYGIGGHRYSFHAREGGVVAATTHQATLDWYDVDDLAPDGRPVIDTTTIMGVRAKVIGGAVDGDPTGQFYIALWQVSGRQLRFSGTFRSLDAFLTVATTVHRVNEKAFLHAMPASVVQPAAHRAAINTMLADITTPPGLNLSALYDDGSVIGRYYVGADVTQAVTCGWVRAYTDGDEATKARAARAMSSAHHWAILTEMKKQGDFPLAVWSVADYMNHVSVGSPGTTGENLSVTNSVSVMKWANNQLSC